MKRPHNEAGIPELEVSNCPNFPFCGCMEACDRDRRAPEGAVVAYCLGAAILVVAVAVGAFIYG